MEGRGGKLIALSVAAACSLAFAGPAHADQVVDDLADTANVAADGDCDAPGTDSCTLREAILETNASAGLDEITFSINGTISLTGQLNPTDPVTIDGNGSDAMGTVIDGDDTFRLFLLNGPVATFEDLRLQDGGVVNPGADGGAAIRTTNDLTLDNVTVTSNVITGTGNGNGAGINVIANSLLTVTNSTISNNTISSDGINLGAGIATSVGTTNVTNTAVSGNMITAGIAAAGGGVNAAGVINLLRSSLTGNSVPGPGGGLIATGGPGSITNSTISGNTADNTGGGGVHLTQGADVVNVTLINNSGGSGGSGEGDDLEITTGNAIVRNSIFASTEPCNEAGGMIIEAIPGHNIDEGMTCGFGMANGNMQNTNPSLVATLGAGSPPQDLFIPLATSPAIDNADPTCAGGLTLDNRGIDRPQGPVCDIGAWERDYRDVNVLVTGSGTVTGTGINCVNGAGDCSHEFLDGGPGFVLTATPAAGFQFSSWSHMGGCSSVTGNQCTVDTGNDRTITADFTALPPTGGGAGGGTTTTPTPTPAAPKKCKKGQKLKKGKCVKGKKKRKK
jgi:Divergent InlB B-repeat domain